MTDVLVMIQASEMKKAVEATALHEFIARQRSVGWDIVEQAINTYDSWMLDDDFDANRVLKEIIEQMRARRPLYMPHDRLSASPPRSPKGWKLTLDEEKMFDGALDVAVNLARSENEQHKGLGQIIAGVCAIIHRRVPDTEMPAVPLVAEPMEKL